MNEQKQREAMARVEFGKPIERILPVGERIRIFILNKEGSQDSYYRNYNSHDDVQRVIDGLSPAEFGRYEDELHTVCCKTKTHMLCATPAQKVEAILRAKGLWEEQP